jgi:hypothetical protein
MVIIFQIALELEPQPPQDTPFYVRDDKMVLFGTGNIIENKARAANIFECRVNLDFNRRQLIRAKDGILIGSLDICHEVYIPYRTWKEHIKETKLGISISSSKFT